MLLVYTSCMPPREFGTCLKFASAGQCIRVLAIGGSITCGAGAADPNDGGTLAALSWTAWLERRLNDAFPCTHESAANRSAGTESRHIVVNCCRGASAADFWVDRVAAWIHDRAATNDEWDAPTNPWQYGPVDVAIYEGAINDIQGARSHQSGANECQGCGNLEGVAL